MPADPPPGRLPLVRLRALHRQARMDRAGAPEAALNGLSLDVFAGELVVLLGAAGAGKATLLRLLAGFARPDGGEIFLDGRRVSQTPPHRRGIGFMFAAPALFPHMSVGQNVAFPLQQRGTADVAGAVAAALRRVGLEGCAELPPARLDPVQQQRAALARAIVFAPALLLLDDPFAALDPLAREAMQDLLRGMHGGGMTVIHATADAPEALALAGRIVVLESGRVSQDGPAQALYDAPASLAVARLFGPVNALPGTVEAIEDDLAMVRLACGPLVEALAVDAEAGAACVVAIRPERMAVAAIAAEEFGDGAIAASVLEIVQRGDHVRLRLRVGEDTEISIRRPAGVPLLGLAPGAPAAVAWQPYQARAFNAVG